MELWAGLLREAVCDGLWAQTLELGLKAGGLVQSLTPLSCGSLGMLFNFAVL